MLERGMRITSGTVADAAGVTRQAAHRHLSQMVDRGELHAVGSGRGAHYVAHVLEVTLTRDRAGLREDAFYDEVVQALPAVGTAPDRANRIFHYAFTEMVNNAVDHSGGTRVTCEVRADEKILRAAISDDGIGAFENVRSALGLRNRVDAVGEISKGKTTTDAEHHTGQGIFFTSKAVDWFELASGDIRWIVDNRTADQAIGACDVEGTRVAFEVDLSTTRDMRAVFDEYTTDLEFDRSRTFVRLFSYGTSFVSRSEAKRLLSGLEKFREVVVDFAGVDIVGQGFADEVFRVWARAHTETRLLPVNMIEPVRFMVDRALREGG
jgi:anti-sigma regulatory factor (Ser/Thr protein kinase)